MIIGIGTDLVRFSRIQNVFQRFPRAFPNRILHREEYAKFKTIDTSQQYRFLAKIFAAKEALLKALGTGLSQNIRWKDIWVSRQPSGCPCASFEGGALKVLQKILEPGTVAKIHLTLSDEADFVQAFAIISLEFGTSI